MTIQLIGGEMPTWSDLTTSRGRGPVRGSVFIPLMATATGRTLIVGPHDPAVIDAAPAPHVTLLVRGVSDAAALADRYADRPGVTVCCGSPEQLGDDVRFDTVVAFDGLGRLASTEGSQPGWADALRSLTDRLAPGGRLLLTVENFLGVHRLVALPDASDDADWTPAAAYDPTRPAGLTRLRTRLRHAGFDVTSTYAAFGSPTAPTVLLGEEILADDRLRGFLEATVRRACLPPRDVLADPGQIAVNALRHGAATELAPAWVLLARFDPAGADTIGSIDASLPAAIVATGSRHVEISTDDRGFRWASGTDADEFVPAGPTLESLLIGACLRRDLVTVREALTTWQSSATAGVPADHVIVGPGGDLTGLVPSGAPAAALRAFATMLIDEGLPHPWPAPDDVDDLAGTLAAMAGVTPASVVDNLVDVAQPRRAAVLREVIVARDRLARELSEAEAQSQWYEETLDANETALREARRTIDLLSGSGPARLGMAMMGGARVARRRVRGLTRTMRELRRR